MKTRFTLLGFAFVLLCSLPATAQSTFNVPTDGLPLNEFIEANHDSTALSTYVLERDGYYVLTASITYRKNDIAVVAAEGEGAMPVIISGLTDEGGSAAWGLFYTSHDLILRGLELNCSNVNGARGPWSNALMNHNGINCTIEITDCVVEYCDGVAVWNESLDGNTVILRNNVFRWAGVSGGGKWQGFVSLLKNGTVEMLICENNTFVENFSCMFIHENGWMKNAYFNHNTIVSNGQAAFRYTNADRMVFTNNLIVDGHFGGELLGDVLVSDPDGQAAGVYTLDYYRVDTLIPTGYPAEEDRINVIANNVNFVSQGIKDHWAAYEDDSLIVADYTKGDNGFLNERSMQMMKSEGDFNYPYFKWSDEYSIFTDDPQFASYTVKVADEIEISKNMNNFESAPPEENGTWGRFPEAEGNAAYPLPKDYHTFEYNNADYKTGGFDGYPIGDLNWWPDQKAAWESDGSVHTYDEIIASVLDGTFQFPTAIKPEGSLQSQLSVYPNPAKGHASLSVDLKSGGKIRVTMFNIFGQEVLNIHDMATGGGKYLMDLDVSDLASGSYFIRVTTENNSFTTKFIVRR